MKYYIEKQRLTKKYLIEQAIQQNNIHACGNMKNGVNTSYLLNQSL